MNESYAEPLPREVAVNIDPDRFIELCQNVPAEQAWMAIGRLAMYANGVNYPAVHIWLSATGKDSQAEIMAVYRDDRGNARFTMGAVWHDDHFGFHS